MSKLLDFLSYFAIFASGALVGVFVTVLANAGARADECAECRKENSLDKMIAREIESRLDAMVDEEPDEETMAFIYALTRKEEYNA